MLGLLTSKKKTSALETPSAPSTLGTLDILDTPSASGTLDTLDILGTPGASAILDKSTAALDLLVSSMDLIADEMAERSVAMSNNINTKIQIKDLDLYYSDYHALHSINMDIPENRITAFIGPSGCGKSTLLRSLNRMNDLVEGCKIEGQVILDGENVYRNNTDVNMLRKRVGMVFQNPNPFPMSVYDNIAFGPKTHGIKGRDKLDEIVESALKKAAIWDELKDRLNKSALGLSGGQQQRLCIARALAVEPEVLLMDEATSALDPLSTGRIEDLAMELKKDYTVVMVTHNMQQAARISDMCAFFLLGDLVEYNETEKLFSQPNDKRTEDYITGRFG